jgi:hypothetical protein
LPNNQPICEAPRPQGGASRKRNTVFIVPLDPAYKAGLAGHLPARDNYAVSLTDKDFQTGSLKQPSNVRPNRIFTADGHIVLYRVGGLRVEKLNAIIEKVVDIIRS